MAPIRVLRPNSSSGGRSFPRTEEVRAPPTTRSIAAPAIREVTFAEISLGSVISQGGFSVVHRANWKGASVAVKVIVDPVITPDLRNEFDNEVAMLNYLRHPGTILLMGVCSTPPKLAVITEFAEGGSLFDLLHKTRRDFPMEDRVEILKKVASVMQFYHESGVVHRDLKSMNVLLDMYLNVKMCDFGLARFKVSIT
jgi:serine/threonine protein kinase